MFRKFFRDTRGNYALLTVVALVPLMGALALAVDYTEISRQRQDTLNALDAAGLATARYIASGVSDSQAIAYANNFFTANLRHVDPVNTVLTVVLPNNSAGGGTLKMCADLTYSPYFLPAAAMLIGRESSDFNFTTCSEIRLKNTLEVALVLDNSGSMDTKGGSTGKPRMTLLKAAAKQLVETLSLQAEQMKQMEKPVQFSLVPFAASVNVGNENKDATWMDLRGISPIHHENFDWSKMTKANSANKYIEKSGDIYYMRGKDWGSDQNKEMTRFKLYELIKTQVCDVKNGSNCKTFGKSKQYEEWAGCVEARPFPYNDNDASPTSSDPATLFVPMFAPDEAGNFWTGTDEFGKAHTSTTTWSYNNNWWVDSDDSLGVKARQQDARKYFLEKPWNVTSASGTRGPNYSCTTTAITPLQDVTTESGKKKIFDSIDAMQSNGNTNVPEGLAWGWRTVSSNEPFANGRPNTDKGNDKVVIVLTDGANTYSAMSDSKNASNLSTYAAYGYAGIVPQGASLTRLFMNTDSTVSKTTYSSSNYTAALDWHLKTLCENAKDSNILLMTVSLDLSEKKSDEKKAINALTDCASDSRYRRDPNNPAKPAKLYWNATSDNLSDKFKEIADELSNLRIVK